MQGVSKLTLGTVQFGLNYGISNQHGVPDDAELQAILKLAKQNEIHMLDTAAAYGNAEERLGLNVRNQFDIITKFPNVGSEKELEKQLKISLDRLKTDHIYGYLAHNADLLIENPGFWNILQEAKSQNKIQKIGYSLYHPEQLHQLIALNCVPDLVQLPYSILDRKFENELSILKKMGTEIHVRSVFLQGLYFMDIGNLSVKLQPLQPALQKLLSFCADENVTVAEAALNFAVSNPEIDKVVIGVENAAQLQNNTDMVAGWKSNPGLFSKINTIDVEDKALLNPANW